MADIITWFAIAVGTFLAVACLRLAYEDWRDGRG